MMMELMVGGGDNEELEENDGKAEKARKREETESKRDVGRERERD